MGFVEEVKAQLLSASLITTTNFFKGPKAVIPSGPNVGPGPFVQMTQTGGSPDQQIQNDLDGYEKPGAQIVVTANEASVAESTAKAIRTYLKKIRNTFLSGTWYQEITADQQVYDFPLDAAAGRPRSGFNISAIKRPS